MDKVVGIESTEFQRIEAILLDLAQPLNATGLARTEDGSWMLSFDHEEWMEITYDEERQLVSLLKELSSPTENNRSSLYAMALQYNFLSNETGGGRLSLEDDEGALFYSVDIAASLCTVSHLKRVMQNSLTVCESWKVIIKAEPSASDGTDCQLRDWI
ncbi:MAG: type III secretion system chaperone [Pseudomonadota bacterium]